MKAAGSEAGGERERAGVAFFPDTRGESVKLIKFRKNFYNTGPLKYVQVYTRGQFMFFHVAGRATYGIAENTEVGKAADG